MTTTLYGKSLLSLLDLSAAEIYHLLDLAHKLKLKRQQGVRGNLLAGKNIALLFEKASTRTRCAFEIAAHEEGGYASYLDIASSQFGYKESVADSARVLAGFYHAIQYRGYAQQTVCDLAAYAQIPVYNGLTDEDHPTQILADLMTIQEYVPTKPLAQVKVAYIGDTRNNMCNAWMYGCAQLGMHFVGFGPRELAPSPQVMAKVHAAAAVSGAQITISEDPAVLKGADVIYTDVWVSMGEEEQLVERARLLSQYQVTMAMLQLTNNPHVIFLHCLPAFHDFATKLVHDAYTKLGVDIREVSDEVFKSPHSHVFAQAANRLHSIKALLVATLCPEY